MSKENLLEFANNITNIFSKRSVTQSLPQMKAQDVSSQGLLSKLGISWLPSKAAGFYLSGKQIKILHEPKLFYKLLLEKCSQANHRIVLASLYLGTSMLEANLVSAINQQLAEKPNLKVKVLLDCVRGSRGEVNSRSMLLPLLENHNNSCQVSLYHTPALRGPLFSFLPHKYKEIVGLQHIKVYLFDDDLIISGANLSSDYFTARQDRYMVITGCKELADFIEGLVNKVSECSFQLDADNKLSLHKNWELHPEECNPNAFYSAASNHIWSYYRNYVGDHLNETDENDTVIFPMIEMGPFNIHTDSEVTTKVLKEASSLSEMYLTTGYFNLTDGYADTIIKSAAKYYILMSHPTANGFHNAKGPAGGIPFAYTDIAAKFLNEVVSNKQSFRINLFEYLRPNWTYHAKGLWLTPENSTLPCLTLIGSPNFGERSVKHDLECQFLLATTNEQLQKDLKIERDLLYSLSKPFTKETIDEPERKTPFWVKVVVFLFRSYL